jgi:hypothetical protein
MMGTIGRDKKRQECEAKNVRGPGRRTRKIMMEEV